MHPTTEEELPICPFSGHTVAVMKEPANVTITANVVIRIEGNVPWQWRVGSGGNYVAMCEPLKITLQAPSWIELMEDISSSLDALLKDLLESRELDAFMQEHGWNLLAPIPDRANGMRFDVPFSILPVAAMEANGSQRVLH
jgi:hypothetical protein